MKLNKTKPSSESKLAKIAAKVSALESRESDSSNPAGWLTRGKRVAAFAESVKNSSNRMRKPEFYVMEGQTKRIRFRQSEPLGCFQVYAFRHKGRWETYTAPMEGERDMFREAGLRPMFKAVYEIVDLDGYTPKKGKNAGKRVRNVPSFYVVGMKLYEQISILQKKYGDLTERTFSVTRTGSGQNTVYTILPEDPEEMPELDKIPSIKGKLEALYAPPTLSEQKALMANYSPEDDEAPVQRRQSREKED